MSGSCLVGGCGAGVGLPERLRDVDDEEEDQRSDGGAHLCGGPAGAHAPRAPAPRPAVHPHARVRHQPRHQHPRHHLQNVLPRNQLAFFLYTTGSANTFTAHLMVNGHRSSPYTCHFRNITALVTLFTTGIQNYLGAVIIGCDLL